MLARCMPVAYPCRAPSCVPVRALADAFRAPGRRREGGDRRGKMSKSAGQAGENRKKKSKKSKKSP